jgi:hypothetical protein
VADRRLNTKSIFFLELNWFNLLFVLLFRIAGIRVYYLTATSIWRKEKHIIRLRKLGIVWMNFQDYNINNSKGVLSKVNILIEQTTYFLNQKNIFTDATKVFNLREDEGHFITSSITSKLHGRINLISELLILGEVILEENPARGILWIPKDALSINIIDNEVDWTNCYPSYLATINYILQGIWNICGLILKYLTHISQIMVGRVSDSELKQISHESLTASNYEDYEIIFFPHDGIMYGNFYIFDHYYSADINSPFSASNILHFSLSDEPNNKNTIQYYKKNKIPFSPWKNIPAFTITEQLTFMFLFVYKYFAKAFKEIDLYLFLVLLYSYFKTKIYIKRLGSIPKLKIVLVGYDIQFPRELALACKITGVKTVAVQERMFSAWWTSPMIIENYLVMGKNASQILEKRFHNLIENKYEIGPIRLSNYFEVSPKNKKLTKPIQNYKWRVLALDFHSSPDYYDNGRSLIANWRNNYKFYQDILKLCSFFPQAYFMIKGKNFDFVNNPYFSDIVVNIEKSPNCKLIKNYEEWTPVKVVSSTDITVALHTSLGDEILALGKPVIFYDYFRFPSELLDYGSNVMSFTFFDLRLKLETFFVNPVKYNQKLDPTRKQFYNSSKWTPKQLLHKQLNKIYQKP